MNRQTRCVLIATLLAPNVYAQNHIDPPQRDPNDVVDVIPRFEPKDHRYPKPCVEIDLPRFQEPTHTVFMPIMKTPKTEPFPHTTCCF